MAHNTAAMQCATANHRNILSAHSRRAEVRYGQSPKGNYDNAKEPRTPKSQGTAMPKGQLGQGSKTQLSQRAKEPTTAESFEGALHG